MTGMGYYQNVRPEMLPFVPANSRRVVEFGCGCGRFGSEVRRTIGAEVWGVELSQDAAEQARPVLDRVLTGDVLACMDQLPDRHFDCAVFNDILEHLVDPWLVLSKLREKLTDKGVVIASLPNIRQFGSLKRLVWDADFPYEDQGIYDRTHLRFFTRMSITRMFHDSGYAPERIVGINAGRPVRLFMRTAFAMAIFLGGIKVSDMQYQQFAVVARVPSSVI